MSRSSVLILLGILTTLVPFAGIPSNWYVVLLPPLGLLVVLIGFLIRTDQVTALRKEIPTPPEVKNDIVSHIT
jgi:hypothetical protein